MLLQSRSLARLAASGKAVAAPPGGPVYVDFTALAEQDPLSAGGAWSNNTQGVGGNTAPGTGTSMRILTRTGGGGVIAVGSAAAQVNYEDSFAFLPGVIAPGSNYRVTATIWLASGYAPSDNHELELLIGCRTAANFHRWIECLWSISGNQETIDQNGDFTFSAVTPFGSSTSLLTGPPSNGDKMVAEFYPAANRVRWGRIRSGVTVWGQDTTSATYINGTLGNGIGIGAFRRAGTTVAASYGFSDITIEAF